VILSPAGRVTVLLGLTRHDMTDDEIESLLASIGNDADASKVLSPGFLRLLAAVARAWTAQLGEELPK